MALIKIPTFSKSGSKNKRGDVNLGTVFDKNSRNKILGEKTPFAIREMYNTIRTRLMFTSKGDRCPVYVITSAEPGDGKTLNAINIAITFAEMGKKCLIIDGDMRNPSIHKFFDIRRENGLSEVLAGIAETVNVRKTKYENLFLLPAGGIPPRPGELLGSEKLKELMGFVREHFDYVFIDTPPAGLVSDASLLAEVRQLLADPGRLETMGRAMGALSVPDAVDKICDKILDLAGK